MRNAWIGGMCPTSGSNPKQIQMMLGHSTITITMDRYGHLFEADDGEQARRVDARIRAALVEDSPARGEVVQLA